MKKVEKPWGSEEWWAEVPGQYLGKILRVNRGHSLSLQVHTYKHETMRVLQGRGSILLGTDPDDLTEHEMIPGEVFDIPPGLIHRVTSDAFQIGFLEILEVSTHHPDDITRLQDDYARS